MNTIQIIVNRIEYIENRITVVNKTIDAINSGTEYINVEDNGAIEALKGALLKSEDELINLYDDLSEEEQSRSEINNS